jgi:secreted PhoX family phosphatase
MLTHLECSPAALYLSELVQAGAWRVARSSPVDTTAVHGLNLLCSGQVTPWGTLLSGEEYETDVGLLEGGSIPEHPPGKADDKPLADWSGFPARQRYAPGISPWWNGMMVETTILDATGATRVERHPAMGRFSHELGAVMPDRRTVYLTDDNGFGGLYMFVADKAGDLSAGHLYAAKVEGSDRWKISWIDLGHATDAAISAAIDRGVEFGELYLRHAPPCEQGEVARRGPQNVDECLLLKGDPILASRLDTRRYTALVRGTLELEKNEGLALDAGRRTLYLAVTRVGGGMLADSPQNFDRIQMLSNPCGVVMRLPLESGGSDTDGKPIPTEWLATRATVAIAGRPQAKGCAEGTLSNPDNLTFVPPLDALYVAEDTSRSPNRLWSWSIPDERLVEVWSAPPAERPGEVSGLGYTSLGGEPYVTVAVQSPQDQPAFSGLLGPLR